METIKPFAVVALLDPLPERGLKRGQVGTVVEQLAPDAYEIEFSDDEGRTYASVGVPATQLLVLHHSADSDTPGVHSHR